MASPFKHAKRLLERNSMQPNGKRKRQKFSSLQKTKSKPSPSAAVFRILCPASKSGSVIGKGGGIITKIRKETGARIRIEEIIPGCEERVVVITGSEKEMEDQNGQVKEEDPYTDDVDEDDQTKTNDDSLEEKESSGMDGTQLEETTSAAQKALLLVFERISESDAESDFVDEGQKTSSARLLVLSSQVGCLMGKSGSVIKQMTSESGAQIHILARDKLPACASPVDEVVQVTGATESVRKALQFISQQLLENRPRDQDFLLPEKIPGPSIHSFPSLPQVGQNEILPPSNFHIIDQGLPFTQRPHEMFEVRLRIPPTLSKFPEIAGPVKVPVSAEPLTFRLICSSDKVGSVIGKGGSVVKVIQSETGCEIKVVETVPDSEDRIIVITGPAHPDDRVSPVQDAVIRVQNRIMMTSPDSKESTNPTKVIISSNQTGCLLGKGGSIVSEMRKLSGAQIRIVSKGLPKYAENEVIVQVTGKFEAVQEALLQITSRLKYHIFSEKYSSIGHHGHPAFVDQISPFPSFMGRRDRSPSWPFPNVLPQFQKFDPLGVIPRDELSGPTRTHYLSGPGHVGERMQSSAAWRPQGVFGRDGPSDPVGASQRRLSGFSSGNQPSLILNTFDVVVPRSLVPIIRGEDGGCLKQICHISGANITITDSRPGATETVILVSGTPDQTHAAQSLLQAFVLSESGSA